MSDKEFFEYNVDNIFKNLLQAEYHAKNIIGGTVPPEHLSCINKHLAFVEGEAEEATAHCELARPELCGFFREFLQKVKALRSELRKQGAGPELQAKIRSLRKDIESVFKEYDTSQCKVCKVIFNPKGGGNMGERKVPELLEKELRDLMAGKPEALSEILNILEDECYETASHLRTHWQDQVTAKWWERIGRRLGHIAAEVVEELGDPVSPEVVRRMRERGLEVLPHPICVLSKVSKGLSRERAEEECISEGKLHPISIILSRTVD